MPFNWNQPKLLDISIPKSPEQLERERNVQMIKESFARRRAAEAEALANRRIPDPLPRGIALTPDQGALGSMRVRAGFSPYDDTPVDPQTGYPLVNAQDTPALNTPVNFTQPAQGFASNAAATSPPPQPLAATNGQAYDESAMAAGKFIPQAQFSAPVNASVDQLIAWMEANPGVLPPPESVKTLRPTQRTQADLDALGNEVQRRGFEQGNDADEIRRFNNYMEEKFPPSLWQALKDIAFHWPGTAIYGIARSAPAFLDADNRLEALNKTDQQPGADKYAHALANFNATRSSGFGNQSARFLSDMKEAYDAASIPVIKPGQGDPQYMIDNDQAFNHLGRILSRLYPNESGEDLLKFLLLRKPE